MVDYNLPLYQHPAEVWDAKKCQQMARYRATDGMGTPYPFLGYIGDSCYGDIRYNGGCERGGKWWQGEKHPLPVVAEGFEIIHVPTWGYRIRKVVTP